MTLHPVRRAALATIAAVLLLAGAARACNVPVFRYALERWPSDPYEFLVFHRGPLGPADKALTDALEKLADASPPAANFTFERIDVSRKLDKETAAVFKAQGDKELPLLVVRYPDPAGIDAPLWSGPLSADALRQLFDSPARRAVVRRLVTGDSAVWILLTCGDRAKDAAAEKLLKTELLKLQQTLKLPELTADPEDKISAKGPDLKLAFSLVRVARDDPAERHFVRLLLGLEPDLRGRKEPMAFAVFGRGRALPPLIGAGLTAKNLAGDARFLTGPCTCKVKEQNPGVDLLMIADWEASAARQPSLNLPGGEAPPMPAALPSPVAAAEKPSIPPLLRNALLAGAGGLVLVGGLTFLLMRKNKGWG